MKNYFIVFVFLLVSYLSFSQCAIISQPLATQSVCQNGATTPLEVTNDPPAQCTSVCSGGGGQGIASYQWFVNNISSTSGAQLIVGANSNIYVPASNLVGTSYYYCEISIDGCLWNQSSIALVTINPLPTVNPPVSETLCNGTSTTPILFTGAIPGTNFSWTNGNTSIGLNGSGTGDISSFNVSNFSPTVQVAVIAVVPSFTNSGLTCYGQSQAFSITVNPTPTIFPVNNQVFCNNETTNPILFTGGTPGTTFIWTNSNPNIGIGPSGAGNISPFIAINNSTNPIVAPINVVSVNTFNNVSCAGQAQTFDITVNPTPTAVFINYFTPFCSADSTWQVTFTSTLSYQPNGMFSSVPAGLSLNSSTGTISTNTSTPGIYTVTYIGSCTQEIASTTVTVGQTGSFSVAVFNDLDQNCSLNTESGIEGMLISIQPGNHIASSNTNGVASFSNLPDGIYTATIDTTNLNWSTSCPGSQTFSIQNGSADCISFGLTNNNPCTDPDVSISAPFLTAGFPGQMVYVSACNQITASSVLNASYVDVQLDPLMTITSSSLPYTAQGNNVFRFQTGNINPGQCVNFNIATTISINAFGLTLCMDANLHPVEPCVFDTDPAPMATGVTPCNLPWDQSSLSVNGWCQGDSVYFTITNTGDLGGGDMECYSPVRVYVDGVLTYFDSIMIQGGTTVTYSYFGNGQTWILQADQHPLHPGNSHPNAHVEACGDVSNWTPDLVNNFPQDDADPIVDIYCGWVTGAWDPNDKRGYPTGIGATNDILPNTDLQYVIRFQNTGTDTAFTVVIRDTLDTDLNIFTVTSGVSSHNYSFTMHGPRVLEWTFNNINLPDSSANEPESHGFVTFQVKQVPDLSAGTEINNNVGIYFDFNAPVITNTTLHTINPCINTITQTTNSSPYACSTYTAPNGQVLSESGTYQIISQDANGCNTIHNISLSISTFEATATLVGPNTLQASSGVTYQWIDCSTGQILSSETNQTVVVNNGEYAVIVNDGQCSDQSDCITVNTVDIKEGKLSFNLHPNPSNGLVIVEALGIEPTEYVILSMDGRILHAGMLHNGLTALDLNQLTNGTYIFNFNGKQLRFVISK
jgi:uncharacterized repeat protein (TIGR01451 family)